MSIIRKFIFLTSSIKVLSNYDQTCYAWHLPSLGQNVSQISTDCSEAVYIFRILWECMCCLYGEGGGLKGALRPMGLLFTNYAWHVFLLQNIKSVECLKTFGPLVLKRFFNLITYLPKAPFVAIKRLIVSSWIRRLVPSWSRCNYRCKWR